MVDSMQGVATCVNFVSRKVKEANNRCVRERRSVKLSKILFLTMEIYKDEF